METPIGDDEDSHLGDLGRSNTLLPMEIALQDSMKDVKEVLDLSPPVRQKSYE